MTDSRPQPTGDDRDPMLEWGLGELGREPVDLVAAVHSRVAAERPPHTRPARAARWLLAAGILLGSAVVLTLALWQPNSTEQEAGPPPEDGQQQPDPNRDDAAQDRRKPLEAYHVHTLADARAAPLDTRAVLASSVDDETVAALARLRNLEELTIREPSNETFGLGLKTVPVGLPNFVTNACWSTFAKFTKLRVLRLSGTSLIARIRTGHGDEVVHAVEHLPLLEELSLRMLDCDDAVLARLPGLRNLKRLNLDFNHGFTEAGIEALTRCEQLESLSLEGCQQLHGNWLGRLAALPRLQRLNLRSIDHLNWRAGTAEPAPGKDPEGQELRRRATKVADSLNAGIHDGTLRSLAKATRLRVLRMSNGHWTATGLSALGQCATLRELEMFGGRESNHVFVQSLPVGLTRLTVCADFTDDFCDAVRHHLPNLRHLEIAACDKITDAGIAELLQMPALRVLDMRQMRGLTAAIVDDLAEARQLEALDLRHNDWLTAAHVARLRRALPGLKELQSNH